jgi:hypothetical protein
MQLPALSKQKVIKSASLAGVEFQVVKLRLIFVMEKIIPE